jgi:hypothetical protein
MLKQTVSIAFCDRCDASTARFERDWRAYIDRGRNGETYVTIACPACSERNFGEDEAAWSD